MEENNSVNKTESRSNVNNVLVFIIIILVILLGIAGYFLFMKNGEDKNSEQTSTSTNEPTNTETIDEASYEIVANTIFHSKDGNDTFTITELEKRDNSLYSFRAKYGNKMYTYYLSELSSQLGQYLSVTGDPDTGATGQCYSSGVLLDLKNKTIE